MNTIRAVILSDTHIPDAAAYLPVPLMEELANADVIFHLGDFISVDVLIELEALKETHAVFGNCDPFEVRMRLGEEKIVELAGRRIGLWHGSGGPASLPDRVARRFNGLDIALFGHSHVPYVEDRGGLLLINPGSPTQRARSGRNTYAVLSLGEDTRVEIVDLQPPA